MSTLCPHCGAHHGFGAAQLEGHGMMKSDPNIQRIADLERQLAERDAALARCVGALGAIELEASIFRVDPPMSEDELMAKFEAISELAGNTLESLPA